MLSSDYLSLIERNIKVPYICLDFYDRKHEFDAVITDNFYGMYKLVNYLFEMGHKKIAYVGTLLSTNSITDRYMGYYKAMLEHGQEVPADYVIDDRSKDTRARCSNYDFVLPKDMPCLLYTSYKDRDEIKENWQLSTEFTHQMGEEHRRQLLKGWRRAVRCALVWADDEDRITG